MAEIIDLKKLGESASTPKEKEDFARLKELIRAGREEDEARIAREKVETEERARRVAEEEMRLAELHEEFNKVVENVGQALGANSGDNFIERKIADFDTDKKIFAGEPEKFENTAPDTSGDAKVFSLEESAKIREELAKLEAEKAGK